MLKVLKIIVDGQLSAHFGLRSNRSFPLAASFLVLLGTAFSSISKQIAVRFRIQGQIPGLTTVDTK
jgi:hypothetical protein